jgi:hypothetical protein
VVERISGFAGDNFGIRRAHEDSDVRLTIQCTLFVKRVHRFQCPPDGIFSSLASLSSDVAAAKRDVAVTAAINCADLVADIPLDCEMAVAATVREFRFVY